MMFQRSCCLIFILSTLSTSAFAADHVLKWGVNVEPIVYFSAASKEFKKRVETRSKGRIEVQLFENASPKEGHDHLADVKKGTYHMGQETVFQLQKHIPELEIWNLPFLFTNDDHVIRYMNSKGAAQNMQKLEAHGVLGLSYTYSGGFLYIFGDKINQFADLKDSGLGLEESSEDYTRFLQSDLGIKTKSLNLSSTILLKSLHPQAVKSSLSQKKEVFILILRITV